MLIDKIGKLKSLVEERKNVDNIAKNIDTLKDLESKGEKILESLRELTDYYDALNPPNDLLSNLDNTLNRIKVIVENLNKGVNSNRDADSISKSFSDIRKKLIDHWHTTKNQYSSRSELDTARLLIQLGHPSISKISSKLSELKTILDGDLDKLATPKTIAKIDKLFTELSELSKDAVSEMSPKVKQFVDKLCSYEQVTLSDLNEEILDWCRKNHLLDKIVLKLGKMT
jgi:uncharacterized coiled-coil DUF342 family protein